MHQSIRGPALLRRLLGSESNVVHSYAATCVERLLAQREHGKPRFAPEELAPLLQPLLEKLFAAFKLPESGGWVGGSSVHGRGRVTPPALR